MAYLVYKHTNLINGKIYIGITSKTPEERWKNGSGYMGNKHFYSAIQKYGWNNFEHEVLYRDLTDTEAYSLEKELIAKYNSNNSNFGYNYSSGGEFVHLGVKHSEETRRKMSENHADMSGERNPNSVKIICLDTKEIFNSIGEAGRIFGIHKCGIHNVLKHKAKSAGGLHFEYLDKYDPNKEYDLSVGATEESIQRGIEKKKG